MNCVDISSENQHLETNVSPQNNAIWRAPFLISLSRRLFSIWVTSCSWPWALKCGVLYETKWFAQGFSCFITQGKERKKPGLWKSTYCFFQWHSSLRSWRAISPWQVLSRVVHIIICVEGIARLERWRYHTMQVYIQQVISFSFMVFLDLLELVLLY